MSKIINDPERPVIEAGFKLGKYLLDKQQSIERLLNLRANVCFDGGAPDNADKLFGAYRRACEGRSYGNYGLLPVSGDNMTTTIFGTDQANIAFRFWHDILHCTYGLDFSLKSEVAIGEMHVAEIKRIFGADSLDARIMEADTVGQSIYQSIKGQFPKDQTRFATGYVLHGAAYAFTSFIDTL